LADWLVAVALVAVKQVVVVVMQVAFVEVVVIEVVFAVAAVVVEMADRSFHLRLGDKKGKVPKVW